MAQFLFLGLKRIYQRAFKLPIIRRGKIIKFRFFCCMIKGAYHTKLSFTKPLCPIYHTLPFYHSHAPLSTLMTLVSCGIKLWAEQRLPKVLVNCCPFCSSVAHTGIYSMVQCLVGMASFGRVDESDSVMSVAMGSAGVAVGLAQAVSSNGQSRIRYFMSTPSWAINWYVHWGILYHKPSCSQLYFITHW